MAIEDCCSQGLPFRAFKPCDHRTVTRASIPDFQESHLRRSRQSFADRDSFREDGPWYLITILLAS